MNALAPSITIQRAFPKTPAERRRLRAEQRLFRERQEQERTYVELKAAFDQLRTERQLEVSDRRPEALLHFCLKPSTIDKLRPAQLVQWAAHGAAFRLTPQRNPRNGRLQVRVSDATTNRWLCVWQYDQFWNMNRWLYGTGR